mgnify:CR=1 FL=1
MKSGFLYRSSADYVALDYVCKKINKAKVVIGTRADYM